MRLAKLRRCSQILFFALFVFLLVRTEFRGSFRAAAGEIRLPLPVKIFLEADPLAGLVNVLASGALYQGLLWGLLILLPTFFLGRFFCGWICPLGTLNHFFSRLPSESKRGRRLVESNRYRSWQRLKYWILLGGLAASLCGSALLGWLDPISLLVRSLALSVLPGLNYAVDGLLDLLYRSNFWPLVLLAEGLGFLFHRTLLSFRQPYFHQAFWLGAILVVILLMNLRVTRWWCRALCPLGALLGIASRWAILGLEKRTTQCGDCQRCLLACQGGDDPIPGARWRKSECHLCMNCVAGCPEGHIAFKFFPASDAVLRPDLRRRQVVGSLALGAASVPLLRSTLGFAVAGHERLLRPPGALAEGDFLARCIRCGECMKVCPNNALHPALVEAGLEGLWTPVVVPRVGYCEPSCVLCGQVCPTGAIWQITPQEKGWATSASAPGSKPVRLGTAFIDRGRCLPWAMARECIVCEEWCPTSPKAIYLRTVEAPDAEGKLKQVRQPWVNPAACVGCGACEYACPVLDRPAIYVTRAGESRSRASQVLLEPRAKGRI